MSLKTIWDQQKKYNKKIRAEEIINTPEHWTQIYLLGLVSEIDEILRDISWKRHRKKQNRSVDVMNLGHELADLTKYVFSLWEVWGFSSQNMLEFVSAKSDFLDQQWDQEFIPVPSYRPILICDIDGTMGNWRKAFRMWLIRQHGISVPEDLYTTLLMDQSVHLKYPEYEELKDEFERTGGYLMLEPYLDTISMIEELQASFDIYTIVTTARPVKRIHRIWLDTWKWLSDIGLIVDQLRMEKFSRILLADSLNGGENVLMFEDDPNIILRAAQNGIKVFVRRQPYNEQCKHENITMVDKYTDLDPKCYVEHCRCYQPSNED